MSRSVLVLNTGSSSVKYAVMDPDSGVLVADGIVERIANEARPGDVIALLSNGAFGGIHERLLEELGRRT